MADHGLDPELEKSLREAADQAEKDVRADGIISMASYVRTTYETWLKVGFSKKQAFKLARDLYQGLIRR